jgi:DNA-binding protein H-NS
MPILNMKNMDVDALLSLRADIDKRLSERRIELQQQLFRLDGKGTVSTVSTSRRPGRGSSLKGRRVAPKYRGPTGETWAGRGARPRWLAAFMKQGRKLEDFAIGKSTQGGKRKIAKKSRKKRK